MLALLIVVAVVAFTLDWGLAEAVLIVLGLAEVLLLALAHYLVPLLQSFPRLRRSWGFRLARCRRGAADHLQQPGLGRRADPGRRGGGGSGGRGAQPVPQVAALGGADGCTARRSSRWA